MIKTKDLRTYCGMIPMNEEDMFTNWSYAGGEGTHPVVDSEVYEKI